MMSKNLTNDIFNTMVGKGKEIEFTKNKSKEKDEVNSKDNIENNKNSKENDNNQSKEVGITKTKDNGNNSDNSINNSDTEEEVSDKTEETGLEINKDEDEMNPFDSIQSMLTTNKKKKPIKDTHVSRSFFIEKNLLKKFDRVMEGTEKTKIINMMIQAIVDGYEAAQNENRGW